MRGLEEGRFVPGQRLVETELASRFGVGRNAVREAIQWLSAQGVIDVTRHRSPAIRLLEGEEALEVLDVAERVIGLAARAAAASMTREDRPRLRAALDAMQAALTDDTPGAFSRARRHFYGAILEIGGNRELQRMFPALGIHILHAQYRVESSRAAQVGDLRNVVQAAAAGDAAQAEAAGRAYVTALGAAVRKMVGGSQ
ncbi:GntR family transcriptional regulator [Sphingosinithalassobacter tenebrarum]|uniref:GntR family transcriptional regulator n=2 Tax=Stakelama tenebrarum TaxID=2711215 RepID=A0A6G6YB66_9SPHN|nr:GntR family transcriptional regulator [Sphingosinithalassobacter tenebrarum]